MEQTLLEILQNDFDETFTIEHVKLILAKLSDAGFVITENPITDTDANNF